MSSGKVNVNNWDPFNQSNNRVKCPYCDIVGFTWLEHHLAGTVENILPCCKVPIAVKQLLQIGNRGGEENVEEKDHCSNFPSKPTSFSHMDKFKPNFLKTHASGIRKRLKMESPENGNGLELPEGSISSTGDSWLKEVKKSIGSFFYENVIDFDAAKSPSFCKMISLGFGPNVQIPTCDELKGWVLEDALKEMHKHVNDVRSSWAETGSSILIDGWANAEGRNFINIFVDSPKGTIYLRSCDVSDFHENMESMKVLFEQVIAEVGINNVVQIVTYSTSAFIKEIGKQLMEKYRPIFWTVDASCCIELMIDQYGVIVNDTLEKAKIITRFIYSHPQVLKFVQDHTKGGELVALSKTKFALPFFTLENLVSKEKVLKAIFLSSGPQNAIVTSTAEGKRVADLVGDKSFWANARTVLTAAIPLVRVMEWMNKNKSHMDCIYETMDQVKETIKEGFGNKKSQYMKFWNVIDEIWCDHLYSPLHSAGYFLNPTIFYSEDVCIDKEVSVGLCHCVSRTAEDLRVVDLITDQMELYQKAKGGFAVGCKVDKRSNISPAEWWSKYGGECPELRRLAVRILSQTCNGASRFQLKRSLAEKIFKRKRNQIEQQRVSELVFLQYNMQLLNFTSGASDYIMASDEIDPVNDWMGAKCDGC